MGIRLHCGMGWGTKNIKLFEDIDLDDLFDFDQLNNPNERFNGEIVSKKQGHKGYQLYKVIHTPDNLLGYLFFPSAFYYRSWARYSDDLDYAMLGQNENFQDSFIIEKERPWFPFYHYINDKLEPVRSDHIHTQDGKLINLETKKQVYPDVPPNMKYYMKEVIGLSDLDIFLNIKPITAQWWS